MIRPGCWGGFRSLFSRFGRDSRGNIAVIFTIALLPVLTAVGCASDYALAIRIKAKLQAAADAAVWRRFRRDRPVIRRRGDDNRRLGDRGVTDANNVFNSNMTGSPATRFRLDLHGHQNRETLTVQRAVFSQRPGGF